MSGINRALKNYKGTYSSTRKTLGIKCIFISHQQKDKNTCRKIADYLLNTNIDVYFDEYDEDLKDYRQSNNPHGVVDSIRIGINNSSHMLVIVSPNTIQSRWVPWEIGYGYDKTDLGVLTLKGIQDNDLPDYLKTTRILRGTKSLNSYLAGLTGIYESAMESRNLIKSHSMSAHPLDDYLDWNL